MKINKNSREKNTVTLEIEVEVQELKKSVEKTMALASRQVKLPGFRPGKAPRAMVEKVLDEEAIGEEAAQRLISSLYPQVIKETGIEPVDYPKVEILQHLKTKPFIFKLSVDVYPEVKLGKYKGLKVEKHLTAVTDDDVMKVLESLQTRLTAEGQEKPALDDDFAKKVSRFEKLDDLKVEIKNSMQKEREEKAEAEVKDKLVAAVSGDAEIEIPAGMVNREIDIMLDELGGTLAQNNLTLEDYLKGIKKDVNSLREELRKSAEVRVKGKIVLRAVAKAEKMEIKAEELDLEFSQMAMSTGESVAELKNRLNESAKEYINDYLLRRKALDFVLAQAKVEVKEKVEDKVEVKAKEAKES